MESGLITPLAFIRTGAAKAGTSPVGSKRIITITVVIKIVFTLILRMALSGA